MSKTTRVRGRRFNGATTQVMGIINQSCYRIGRDKNGYYQSACFEYDGVSYSMDRTCKLVILDGSSLGNSAEAKVHSAKSGVYSEYLIGGIRVKSYHLTMLMLTDWFYDLYMSSSSMVVNHKVISNCSVRFSNYYATSTPEDGCMSGVEYLEVVSNSANMKHAKFIKYFGLFGLNISALDVDMLTAQITEEYQRRVLLGDETPYTSYNCIYDYLQRDNKLQSKFELLEFDGKEVVVCA